MRNFVTEGTTVLLSVCCAAILAGCESSDKASRVEDSPSVDFVAEVKPILQNHCVRCHNEKHLFGDLDLTNRASVLRGSSNGPVIVPGHPEQSLLYGVTLMDHGKDPKAMPATGPKLSDEEKATLRRWIEQGADWPEGEDGIVPPVEVDIETV